MKLTERHVSKINKLYDDLDDLTQENKRLRQELHDCSKRVELFVEQQAAEAGVTGTIGEACLVAVRPITNHLETQARQLCEQIDRLDMVHLDNRLSRVEQQTRPWWSCLLSIFKKRAINTHNETRRDI